MTRVSDKGLLNFASPATTARNHGSGDTQSLFPIMAIEQKAE